ncbi:MAG: metallophosphoesterase [Muribaculaceae bacterium]|jgi:predicted MPP superfamily phosphohydrolase|nr:metallophosphoesterase [Muribaculaceae bacterium]
MKFWFIPILLIPFIGQYYVCLRTWNVLPLPTALRIVVMILMTLTFAAFFFTFFGQLDRLPFRVAASTYQISTSWIFIMLYLAILFLLLDAGRLLHIVPDEWMHSSLKGSIFVAGIITAVFTYGYFNYNAKRRIPMTIETSKSLVRPLKIVMMADLHLGYINRKDDFHKWVDMVNAEHPDLILIGGDIVDHGIRAVLYQDMASEFHRLKAPIYACLGNHEYYSDNVGCEKFYAAAGVHLLRDNQAIVDGIRIIGRDDRTNQRRKEVSELVGGDNQYFTILLDHQPYHLEDAERAGIDFQFSGHTHYGQLWPVSWIEDAMYEDAFGPYRLGSTQYYVTSGLGIWGAKFRIGTRSEYLVVEIKNKGK